MKYFNDFLNCGGKELIMTLITIFIGYICTKLKSAYQKYVNSNEKRQIAQTCVRAVEQIYKTLHGEDKLNKCVEFMATLLNEKGIAVSEVEMRMLIEAAVNEMNNTLKPIEGIECGVGELISTDDEDCLEEDYIEFIPEDDESSVEEIEGE